MWKPKEDDLFCMVATAIAWTFSSFSCPVSCGRVLSPNAVASAAVVALQVVQIPTHEVKLCALM